MKIGFIYCFYLHFNLRNWFKLSRNIPSIYLIKTCFDQFLKEILFFKKNNKNYDFKKGDIKFINVNFGYDKNQPVIKNINLHIKSGEKIALKEDQIWKILMKLLIRYILQVSKERY